MNGIDWPGDTAEEWPEAFGFGDVAKSVLMPHTVPISLAEKVLDRSRGRQGGRVVHHTQPPPVAQSAREVQGQFAGLLRTVKAVEEKLDENTRQLALVQRASTGVQAGDLFRQSLSSAVLNAVPSAVNKDLWGVLSQLTPVAQNWQGAAASISTKPITTLVFPIIAVGLFAARQPRRPIIVASVQSFAAVTKGSSIFVTIVSPDGADIYYTAAPVGTIPPDPTKGNTKYVGPIEVQAPSSIKARAVSFWRVSEVESLKIS